MLYIYVLWFLVYFISVLCYLFYVVYLCFVFFSLLFICVLRYLVYVVYLCFVFFGLFVYLCFVLLGQGPDRGPGDQHDCTVQGGC